MFFCLFKFLKRKFKTNPPSSKTALFAGLVAETGVHFALRGSVGEALVDELACSHQAIDLHAGLDAHAVQHIDDVLGGHVARGAY